MKTYVTICTIVTLAVGILLGCWFGAKHMSRILPHKHIVIGNKTDEFIAPEHLNLIAICVDNEIRSSNQGRFLFNIQVIGGVLLVGPTPNSPAHVEVNIIAYTPETGDLAEACDLDYALEFFRSRILKEVNHLKREQKR